MSATVLFAGFAATAAREIAEHWRQQGHSPGGQDGEPRRVAGVEAAFAELDQSGMGPAIVCFGPGAPPRELAQRLRRTESVEAGPARRFLVLAAGEELAAFAELVEADRLFFLAARPPAPAEIAALLAAAAADLKTPPPALGLASGEVLRRVLAIERCAGLEETLAALEAAAQKLVPARRACARWLDAETLTLWRPGADPARESRDSIVTGLTGFTARTGRPAAAARIGEDARYDAEADNARRSPRERFLAVALPAGPGAAIQGSAAESVEAVLTLARGEEQPPFGEAELALILALAREAGPILRRRRAAFELARIESETAVFRRQALDHHENGARPRQDPLRLAPPWIGAAYRSLILLSLVVLLVFLAQAGDWGLWPARPAP